MSDGTAGKVLEALMAYDLKLEGPGKYRCNSPLRPGSNSQAFTLTIQDNEHGAYFDHVSNENGSLYDLAKHLNIEVVASPTVENTKRVYKNLEDYALAHGISAADLRSAGWRETICAHRPALAFKTTSGLRWRFIDGDKPYYKSEKGYKACWYGLGPSLAKAITEKRPLVLCNGEISTVVARKHGLAALCVTGGEKAYPPELITELKAFLDDLAMEGEIQLLVAFDCDQTGQHAGRLVAQQMIDAGLQARAVDLGLGGKADLADFCMLHGKDTASALVQLPPLPDTAFSAPMIRRSWYIIPAADLAKLPPIEWIVPGEIPDRGITVLFGPSGAGKSFLALDYALRIAQADPVLYMAGEGEYGYRQRVAAWCKHHAKTESKLFMCIGAVQLLEDGDLQAFLAANRTIKPRIVIVDTMARSMVGSDENSTRDMGMFVQACEEIKHALDCAVLIIHHTNKGGIQERGNSALRGASDAMIKVVAEDDLICVESAKTKDAQPFPTRYMRLITVQVEMDGKIVDSAVMVEADKVFQTADDPLTKGQLDVLRCVAAEDFGADRGEISQATNIPYPSLQKILSRLKQLEYLKQASKGSPYEITDSGKQRLARVDAHDDPLDPTDDPIDPDSAKGKSSLDDPIDPYDPAFFHANDDHDDLDHRDQVDQWDQVDQVDHPQGGTTLFDLPTDESRQHKGAIAL